MSSSVVWLVVEGRGAQGGLSEDGEAEDEGFVLQDVTITATSTVD